MAIGKARIIAPVVHSPTTSLTFAFTMPSDVLGGDLMLIHIIQVASSGSASFAVPTGWTQLAVINSSSLTLRHTAYYKIASGTYGQPSSDAGTTVTFSISTAAAGFGYGSVRSGVSRSTVPLTALTSAESTARVTHTTPAGDARALGAVYELTVADKSGSTHISSNNSTDRFLTDQYTTGGAALGAATYEYTETTPGSQGNHVFTSDLNTATAVMMTIMIIPDVALIADFAVAGPGGSALTTASIGGSNVLVGTGTIQEAVTARAVGGSQYAAHLYTPSTNSTNALLQWTTPTADLQFAASFIFTILELPPLSGAYKTIFQIATSAASAIIYFRPYNNGKFVIGGGAVYYTSAQGLLVPNVRYRFDCTAYAGTTTSNGAWSHSLYNDATGELIDRASGSGVNARATVSGRIVAGYPQDGSSAECDVIHSNIRYAGGATTELGPLPRRQIGWGIAA